MHPAQGKSVDRTPQTDAVEGPAPGCLSCCTLQLSTSQCDLERQSVHVSACPKLACPVSTKKIAHTRA